MGTFYIVTCKEHFYQKQIYISTNYDKTVEDTRKLSWLHPDFTYAITRVSSYCVPEYELYYQDGKLIGHKPISFSLSDTTKPLSDLLFKE